MTEPTEPIQPRPETPYPEESRTFGENQTFFERKHREEAFPPQLEGDHVTLVFKVSRELYNGNLGRQLLTLASQTTPTDRYEAAIVVNNARLYADIGEAYRKQEGDEVSITFDRTDYSPWERDLIAAVSGGQVDIIEGVSTYFENVRTLRILRTITTTTTQLLESQDSQQDGSRIEEALSYISSLLPETMGGPAKRLMLAGAKAAMEQRVRVYGLDASSSEKGYRHSSLLQPMNEGAHVAYGRGASYIDFRDMDEFARDRQSLAELASMLDLPREERPDVVFRTMDTEVSHYPETLEDGANLLETMVQDYVKAIRNAMFYGDISRQLNIGVGRLIVGRDLFEQHQYASPHGFLDASEDYSANKQYVRAMQRGARLIQPASLLVVDSSSKKSSVFDSRRSLVDESDMAKARAAGKDGEFIQGNIRNALAAGQQVEARLEALATGDEGNTVVRELLDDYRRTRLDYFRREQNERERMRAIFFGDGQAGREGILPAALPKIDRTAILSADAEKVRAIVTELLPQLHLGEDAEFYLAQNPLLIKAILQASEKYHLGSQEEIQTFLEGQAFPELLAPPLPEEPDYSAISSLLEDGSRFFNLTDWYHVFQANQHLTARLLNLQSQGNLPNELSELIAVARKY